MGSKRHEITSLPLIQTYCLSSLTYSCEIWSMKRYDVKRVEVDWNNAFRKIFNSHWYESVKPVQFYSCCLPVCYVTYEKPVILLEDAVK